VHQYARCVSSLLCVNSTIDASPSTIDASLLDASILPGSSAVRQTCGMPREHQTPRETPHHYFARARFTIQRYHSTWHVYLMHEWCLYYYIVLPMCLVFLRKCLAILYRHLWLAGMSHVWHRVTSLEPPLTMKGGRQIHAQASEGYLELNRKKIMVPL
jgi:hypothetical protein